jgi:FKBP-type peptidyl-prolyl cis-trans isomerase FklB
MRKRNLYALFLLLLTASFTACSDTEEVNKYENWQARSEAFIDSIANVCKGQHNGSIEVANVEDSIYVFVDQTNYQNIYVKKMKNGPANTPSPFYTSTVSCYYRMSYFNGDVVQQNYTGSEPTGIGDAPTQFTISDLITGWQYVLTYMKVGDFWTIYIPYQSGYDDSTGSDGTLQPYSALVYNVKLASIDELTRADK